jgi:GTP-binding protein Era
VSRYKDKIVSNWINGASVTAAGIGAIPIPGADIVPLTTLQVGLAMKIAYIYDITPAKADVMKLVASTVTGQVGKQAARWAITALKGTGWIPGAQLLEAAACAIGASVAASLTYGFGWACNAYYKSGMKMDLGEVGEVFESSYGEYKQKSSLN